MPVYSTRRSHIKLAGVSRGIERASGSQLVTLIRRLVRVYTRVFSLRERRSPVTNGLSFAFQRNEFSRWRSKNANASRGSDRPIL